MKNLILALLLTLLPLTANAQSGGQSVIQAAADELEPAFCANDLNQAMQIVKNCYANVDRDSQKYNMNQCVIEDFTVISVVRLKQKKALENYQVDPYADLEFMDAGKIGNRILKHPNFASNLTKSEDVKNVLMQAGMETVEKLKQKRCLEIDKLK